MVGQEGHQIQIKGQLQGAQGFKQGQYIPASRGSYEVVGILNTVRDALLLYQLAQVVVC